MSASVGSCVEMMGDPRGDWIRPEHLSTMQDSHIIPVYPRQCQYGRLSASAV